MLLLLVPIFAATLGRSCSGGARARARPTVRGVGVNEVQDAQDAEHDFDDLVAKILVKVRALDLPADELADPVEGVLVQEMGLGLGDELLRLDGAKVAPDQPGGGQADPRVAVQEVGFHGGPDLLGLRPRSLFS